MQYLLMFFMCDRLYKLQRCLYVTSCNVERTLLFNISLLTNPRNIKEHIRLHFTYLGKLITVILYSFMLVVIKFSQVSEPPRSSWEIAGPPSN